MLEIIILVLMKDLLNNKNLEIARIVKIAEAMLKIVTIINNNEKRNVNFVPFFDGGGLCNHLLISP